MFRKKKYLKQGRDGLMVYVIGLGLTKSQCLSLAGQWLEIPIPGCLRKWDPDVGEEVKEKRKHC